MHIHEQLHQLKCGLFLDKIVSFGYYYLTVYWQNITHVNIFKRFCAILYTFDVKYVTFREPVLGLRSQDFIYVYMNRIEINYQVCRLYHYIRPGSSGDGVKHWAIEGQTFTLQVFGRICNNHLGD